MVERERKKDVGNQVSTAEVGNPGFSNLLKHELDHTSLTKEKKTMSTLIKSLVQFSLLNSFTKDIDFSIYLKLAFAPLR